MQDPFLAEALEGGAGLHPADFSHDIHSLNKALDKRVSGSSRRFSFYLGIAASVALLAFCSYFIFKVFDAKPSEANVAWNSEPPPQEDGAKPVHEIPSRPKKPTQNAPSNPIEHREALERDAAPFADNNATVNAEPNETNAALNVEPPVVLQEDSAVPVREQGSSLEETSPTQNATSIPVERRLSRKTPPFATDTSEATAQDVASEHEEEEVTREQGIVQETPLRNASESAATFAKGKPDRIIRGRVIDSEDKSPIPGVNVVLKGTTSGTVTDMNGNYELEVSDNATVVFSYLGLATQEVASSTGNEISVEMYEDAAELSEVVVVGEANEISYEGTKWEMAKPLGGSKEYKSYLEQKMIYPEQAIENKVQGKVTVQFTVQPSGQIDDFRVVKSLGSGCDEEVVRLIKEGPRWTATKRNDEPVKSRVKVKVKFRLPKDEHR